MARMVRTIAPILLLIAAVGMGQPLSARQPALASGTNAKQPLICPPTSDNQRYNDPRDQCATRANELGEDGPGLKSIAGVQSTTCVQSALNPVTDRSFEPDGLLNGLSLDVQFLSADEPTANTQPCDAIASVRPDGSTLVQYYGFNSLTLNFPGDEDYQTTLPIGILVNGAPPPGGVQGQVEPLLTRSGLTLLATRVLVAGSDPNNADTSGNTYIVAALRTYKYTQAESDPSYDYRVAFSTGSGHGGNGDHVMVWMEHRAALANMPSGLLPTDWTPTSTHSRNSGSEQWTVSVALEVPGASASISHTFTLYPNSFGPFYIQPANDLFAYGWKGYKTCGGSPCQYEGAGGGTEFKYPEGGSYSLHKQIRVCWQNYIGVSHCKWGQVP